MFALVRRWAVVAALPLLGVLGIVSGARSYRCSGDQLTRDECCCPEHPTLDEANASVSAPGCCETTRVEIRDTAGEPARLAAGADRPMLAAVAAFPAAAVPPIASRSFDAVAIRPPPVPILLLKQSRLI